MGALVLLLPSATAAPLSGANADLDKLCTVQGSTYATDTTDANSASTNDVLLGDNLLGSGVDAVFFGMEEPFKALYVDVGTAGTVGVQTWYYWSSTLGTWSTLLVTDGTSSFTTSGTNSVTWSIPTDWGETTIDGTNCTGSRYYVRALTTTVYTTIPRADQVSAIEFNLRVKVQDELGTAVTGLGESAFTVTGGTTNTVFAFRELGTGRYELALDASGADVNFDVKAAKDGYVTSAAQASGSLTTTMTDNTGSPISLSYAYKVTGVTTEGPGTSLSSVTVHSGDSFGTSCTESGGAWYCAVPLANTGVAIRAAKDGYVTNTGTSFASDRTAAADAQVTAAVSGLKFAVKVTSVADELSNALSSVTVTAGALLDTSCTESGGAWYCPVPLADAGTSVRAAKDGYVRKTVLSAYTDRVLATDAQSTATVTGVQFAYKVTSVGDELSNALSSVTVSAGNSYGTSCTESGGAWYCAVPLADTELAIRAAKDGYVTNTGSSFASDRTSSTDAQVAGTVSGVKFALKVTAVSTEISTSLSSVTVAAGDSFGVACTESSGAWYCAVPLAHTTTDVRAAKDGYVTKTASSAFTDRTSATDAQATASVTGVAFAFKVTGITTEGPGASLTSATVATGDSYGTTCTESSGAWYCAVPLAETGVTIRVAKDGYVTNTGSSFASDRTGATDAQVTKAVTGVQYALKVTGVTTELSGSLTSVTVTGGDSYGTTCTESAGAWYCALPASDSSTDVRAAKDGYVTRTASSAFTDRTAATDAQATATVTGVQFAYKVTSVADELSNALSSVTISAGNSYGTSCTESGGAWYCAVPLADTELAIRAAKDGYVTRTSVSFGSDRTSATDAQVTKAVTGVQFAFKVTGITSEASASVTSATVVTGDSFGVSCTESSGAWYCAVPLAHTELAIRVTKAGYLTDSSQSFASDRTAATDAQVTKAITGLTYTLKITLSTETTTSGVTFTKSVGGGSYSSVSADASSAGVAYFAQDPAQSDVIYRATKYSVTSDTGTAFTTSASSQTSKSLALVASLVSPAATGSSVQPSIQATYTLSFTPAHDWPAAGTFTATFPTGYTLGTPSVTLTGAGGTATASVSGQTVTITRAGDGSATAGGTAVTIALTQVTNPSTTGTTGTFAFVLKSAAGTTLDTGTASGVTISAAAGGTGGTTAVYIDPVVTGLTSSTHKPGLWTTSTALTATWSVTNGPAFGYSWAIDKDPDDISEGTFTSVTIKDLTDGTHSLRVKALSSASRWGPVATLGELKIDTRAPTSQASVAAISTGTIAVSWSASDAGAGVLKVELYVRESGGSPRLFHTGTSASGMAVFNGNVGASYEFYSLAIDGADQKETLRGGAAVASRVIALGLVASSDAVSRLQEILGNASAFQNPFQAADTDGDGVAETFLDPNGLLVSHRVLGRDGRLTFLLGLEDGRPVAVWNPEAGEVAEVNSTEPVEPPQAREEPDGRLVVKFRVAKGGWILIKVPDAAPGRMIGQVLRADGTAVPEDQIWREGSQVYILDDPSEEYEIHYNSVGDAQVVGPTLPLAALVSALALAPAIAFLAWVLAPSDVRLRERAPRTRLGRALRLCGACGLPLPRLTRLVRGLHDCSADASASLAKQIVHRQAPPRLESAPKRFEPVDVTAKLRPPLRP